MQQFPAIAIGGPPHSGKSVLTYHLTQILRDQQVGHYVLRACPDGEGDWSNEAPPETVRLLRNKGQFSDSFVANVCRTLQARHLPLLVDVGGRPTPEQEVIFDHCTHAILIAPDEAGLTTWRELTQRHNLPVIAELQSTLTEEDAVYAEYPILQGQISSLERHQALKSTIVDLLAWNIRTLFGQSHTHLQTHHLSVAPVEITVELSRMARALGIAQDGIWRPTDLADVLDYLPDSVSLAIYGRGPNWLYAALAAHAHPALFYQFDARLGWVTPLPLRSTRGIHASPLDVQLVEQADYHLLQVSIRDTYLDYSEVERLPTPPIPPGQSVVIHGRLPHWLVTGYVTVYHGVPWLAIYQPQLQAAVIVTSQVAHRPVGSLVRVAGVE